jgi:hypothetical protein
VRLFRIFSIMGALVLIAGEVFRSWGAERPLVFVLDDFLAGGMVILGAILMNRPTATRRAFFAAGWGVAVGMLYGSFFGKLYDPGSADPGNFSVGVLVALLGLALAIGIGGLAASILLPDERSRT